MQLDNMVVFQDRSGNIVEVRGTLPKGSLIVDVRPPDMVTYDGDDRESLVPVRIVVQCGDDRRTIKLPPEAPNLEAATEQYEKVLKGAEKGEVDVSGVLVGITPWTRAGQDRIQSSWKRLRAMEPPKDAKPASI